MSGLKLFQASILIRLLNPVDGKISHEATPQVELVYHYINDFNRCHDYLYWSNNH